jgi:hypothetical protein
MPLAVGSVARLVEGNAKLTVALPVEAIDTVEKLAKESQKTKTQVLREAIALKAFIEQERAQPGTRILIERDGEIRPLIFRGEGT